MSMLESGRWIWRIEMPPTESLGSSDRVAQCQQMGRQRPTLALRADPAVEHQSTNVLTHFRASVNICVGRIERVIRNLNQYEQMSR
jgi:hypothetical protein